jgi:hypothetical protein
MDKRTNNDLQNTYKTKDLVTRTPLKIGGEHNHIKRHSTLYGKYQIEREMSKLV